MSKILKTTLDLCIAFDPFRENLHRPNLFHYQKHILILELVSLDTKTCVNVYSALEKQTLALNAV